MALNVIGPHWDGNQVWFITGGGAIFAAWPLVYATAFSGFYWAMLAVLWALFFRPVGFDYRSKIDNPTWRQTWDWGLFIGGAVPPLIFGVVSVGPAAGAVALDASALTQFDSSALAVLLACQRAAQARGCVLQVLGLPPKAQQLAKVYGVAPWL